MFILLLQSFHQRGLGSQLLLLLLGPCSLLISKLYNLLLLYRIGICLLFLFRWCRSLCSLTVMFILLLCLLQSLHQRGLGSQLLLLLLGPCRLLLSKLCFLLLFFTSTLLLLRGRTSINLGHPRNLLQLLSRLIINRQSNTLTSLDIHRTNV